jgi:predicted dehydrogenase
LSNIAMNVGIIGCGYVADLYLRTKALHPDVQIVSVYDRNERRLAAFSAHHSLKAARALAEVAADPAIQLILNLTNPDSHYEVSKACLEAGKHVYSEKPLAMNLRDAKALAQLAEEKGLLLASAPCSVLGETAQTLWRAVRQNAVGKIYAVYAEMDDGLVHKMPYRDWTSASGADWPAKDEFQVGCTLEHAGYVLTWLCAMFGPAKTVTAFGATTIANKETDEPLTRDAPDLTVACIKFASGVVARLTCSIVAPHDHGLRLFGEHGVLGTDETWDYRAKVWLKKRHAIRRRMFLTPFKLRQKLLGTHNPIMTYGTASRMDFWRGVVEMLESLKEGRPCRISTKFSLHINELALAISEAGEKGASLALETTFEPMEPMPWAR